MTEPATALRVVEETSAFWRVVFDYPPFNIVDAIIFEGLQDLLERMEAPRWSPQKRPYVVTSKPAKGKRTQDMKLFYTIAASLGKVRWQFRPDQQPCTPTNGRETDAFGFAFKGRF